MALFTASLSDSTASRPSVPVVSPAVHRSPARIQNAGPPVSGCIFPAAPCGLSRQHAHARYHSCKRKAVERYTYTGDDFNTARGETLWTYGLKRGPWQVKTITRTVLQCDENYFYLDAELDAYDGERRIFSNNWNRRIKRNLV